MLNSKLYLFKISNLNCPIFVFHFSPTFVMLILLVLIFDYPVRGCVIIFSTFVMLILLVLILCILWEVAWLFFLLLSRCSFLVLWEVAWLFSFSSLSRPDGELCAQREESQGRSAHPLQVLKRGWQEIRVLDPVENGWFFRKLFSLVWKCLLQAKVLKKLELNTLMHVNFFKNIIGKIGSKMYLYLSR